MGEDDADVSEGWWLCAPGGVRTPNLSRLLLNRVQRFLRCAGGRLLARFLATLTLQVLLDIMCMGRDPPPSSLVVHALLRQRLHAARSKKEA